MPVNGTGRALHGALDSLVASQVKPKDPYAFECNPFKHRKTCFAGQRQCRNGKKVFDDIRPCDDGEFLNNADDDDFFDDDLYEVLGRD